MNNKSTVWLAFWVLKCVSQEQIQYSYCDEFVSSDLIGNPCDSIVDSPATIVSKDNKSIVLYFWYDSEYGYSRQVIRYAKCLADVIRLIYY